MTIQLESGAPGSLVGTTICFLLPARAPVFLDVVGLVGSLVVLAVSGDQFVIALARIAGFLRVRPTAAAAFVGGFGTSIAELIVAGVATARHSSELAVGSLAGSIIANVCLALALAGIIVPIQVDSATVRREMPLSVLGVVIFGMFALSNLTIGRGLVMLVALIAILATLLIVARNNEPNDPLGSELAEFAPTSAHRSTIEVSRAVAMVAFMLGGAELMVTSAVGLSQHLGISQGVAGLTLVGIGTSAPLIAASIQAARRQEHDLVVGNVLGGNLFIALGGGAVVGLLANGHGGGIGSLPVVLMVGSVLAARGALTRGGALVRTEAILLLLAYAIALPLASH